jgi:hypothetical protein
MSGQKNNIEPRFEHSYAHVQHDLCHEMINFKQIYFHIKM